MATPVIMPRQGQTVESCIITQWHKAIGDSISAGDVLFSYETDKAAFDEVSPLEGFMLARFFEEGDDVPVLTNVCIIGQKDEDISEFAPLSAEAAASPGEAEPGQSVKPDESQTPPTSVATAAPGVAGTDRGSDGRLRISPRAKSLAGKAKIDYKHAAPSGPSGRIIERDITSLIQARANAFPVTDALEQPAGVPVPQDPGEQTSVAYEEVRLTNMRKRISEAMHASLSAAAQLTIHSSFDATDILAYRKKLKEAEDDKLRGINITHMVLYAVSKTLLNHRDLNAHLLDDRMLLFNHVNLGVATDTERGLMVPTIFDADEKSLADIADETKRLAGACRTGSISPDYLQGGTFTVTNLGALGVECFTPVLNVPQTAILGVNTTVQRARETGEGIAHYPAIGLSLTFDHRAVDGAPAARFLQELKRNLEGFSVLLAQ